MSVYQYVSHLVTPIAVVSISFSFHSVLARVIIVNHTHEWIRIRVKMCRVNHSVRSTPITAGKKSWLITSDTSFSLRVVDSRSVACLLHNPGNVIPSSYVPHRVRRASCRRPPFHPPASHVQLHRFTCMYHIACIVQCGCVTYTIARSIIARQRAIMDSDTFYVLDFCR